MANQFSVPLGEMKELIDFYDQLPDPDAAGAKQPDQLIASNVWAKIEDLWSTSQPQNLNQQVLTEISHRNHINRLPGLLTRMYIIWHSIDGDKRLDISTIGDPDGNHAYQRILAIERNDGQ